MIDNNYHIIHFPGKYPYLAESKSVLFINICLVLTCTVCSICSVLLHMFNDVRRNCPFFCPNLRISSKLSIVTLHEKSSGSRLFMRKDSRSFTNFIHSPGQCLVVHGTFRVLLSGAALPLRLSVPPIPQRGNTDACQPLPHFSSAAGLHEFGQEPSRVLRKCDRRHGL